MKQPKTDDEAQEKHRGKRRTGAPATMSDIAGSMTGQYSDVKYANSFEVGFNAFEFLFDLGHVFGVDSARVAHTRIVTVPVFARYFLTVLAHSLTQYEAQFGEIADNFGGRQDPRGGHSSGCSPT